MKILKPARKKPYQVGSVASFRFTNPTPRLRCFVLEESSEEDEEVTTPTPARQQQQAGVPAGPAVSAARAIHGAVSPSGEEKAASDSSGLFGTSADSRENAFPTAAAAASQRGDDVDASGPPPRTLVCMLFVCIAQDFDSIEPYRLGKRFPVRADKEVGGSCCRNANDCIDRKTEADDFAVCASSIEKFQ